MKLALYVAGGFVAVLLAVALLALGPAPDSNPAILFAFCVLFGLAPVGAFWMMYMAIRYEKNPFLLVLLAMFIPFTFLWYYFERVRPGKVRRVRDFA